MPHDINQDICVPWQGPDGPYGYHSSLAAGIIFAILFASSAIFHFIEGYRARRWWQFVFTFGGVAEALGWSARIWSSQCPYQMTPFLMQTSTLIFGKHFNFTDSF
jgi:hypothetical protein